MTLTDTILALESANEEFDMFAIRCNALLEASYAEYNINLKEAELKVIEEGGNKSDKDQLQGKASDGLIGKARKIIIGIIEAFKKWVKEACDKVAELFNNAKTKLALKKAERVCKENKEVGNRKIKIFDRKAAKADYDKLEDKVNRKMALLKSGRFTEKDAKEAEKMTEELDAVNKKHTTRTVVVTALALTTILAGAGVAIAKHKSADKDMEKPKDTEIDTPEKAKWFGFFTNIKSRIRKESIKLDLSFFTSGLSKLRSTVSGKGEMDPTIKPDNEKKNKEKKVKEKKKSKDKSTTESTEDSILKDLESEVKNEMSNETVNDEDKYLESLLEELELDYMLAEESVLDYDFDNMYEESANEFDDDEDDELELESAIDELINSLEDDEDEEITESEEAIDDLYNYIATMESELFNESEEDDFDDEMVELERIMESFESIEYDDEDDDDNVTESIIEDILNDIE